MCKNHGQDLRRDTEAMNYRGLMVVSYGLFNLFDVLLSQYEKSRMVVSYGLDIFRYLMGLQIKLIMSTLDQ